MSADQEKWSTMRMMLVDHCSDGVVRCYSYGMYGGMLCRLNSAGDPVKRVCIMPKGMNDFAIAECAIKYHAAYAKCCGTIDWHFC